MKKLIVIFLLNFLFLSCASFKPGKYRSYCIVLGQTVMIANFAKDKTCTYRFLHSDEIINGTWSIKKDTLIVKSEIFATKRDSFAAQIKNSDFKNEDKYIVKGKKLFIVNRNGKTENCYLYKFK